MMNSQKLGELRSEQATAEVECGTLEVELRAIRSWASRIWTNPIVTENLILIVIVGVYILSVHCVHAACGIEDRMILLYFSSSLTRIAVILTGLLFIYHIRKKTFRLLLTPRYLVGFLTVYAILPIFKSVFASYKQSIPLIHPFKWDYSLMRLDYILHFGHHPWRLLESILSSATLVRFADIFYMTWFYLLFLSCLWMGWTLRRRLRLCYLISTLLVWILVGSVLATVLSSAGPCFYSKIVSSSDDPYAPLMLTLSDISERRMRNNQTHLHATFNQAGLWEGKRSGTWGPFGGISAMPSIHLAMATLFAWLAFEIRRWLGWIFVVYVGLIQIGSVILGWHYAVDGYCGIILASLIWLAVNRILRRVDIEELASPLAH